jgi:hypothetical protein
MNVMASHWCKLYQGKDGRGGTPAERALEPAVAALGVPYRFQHPLWLFPEPSGKLNYFPDFILTNQRVVIEVDDDGHFTPANRRKDAERTRKLIAAGYRVVRCTNDEALRFPFATVNKMMRQLGLPLTAEPPTLESP